MYKRDSYLFVLRVGGPQTRKEKYNGGPPLPLCATFARKSEGQSEAARARTRGGLFCHKLAPTALAV